MRVNYVSACVDCESGETESLIDSKKLTLRNAWRGSRRTYAPCINVR